MRELVIIEIAHSCGAGTACVASVLLVLAAKYTLVEVLCQ